MNTYMQTIALIEMSITCAMVLIWCFQKVLQTQMLLTVRLVLLLLLGNLFFWPLGLSLELPLAAYVRGVIGDLSIVSMLLLWGSILVSVKDVPMGVKIWIALLAIIFYPLALGFGMFDPYVWGYGSFGFLIAVVIFGLLCGLAGWVWGVWLISLAIMAWAAHWHESTNLWDYLLDPFLAVWSVCAIITFIYQRRRAKTQSGYLFRAG
jgi:hypothetical protein